MYRKSRSRSGNVIVVVRPSKRKPKYAKRHHRYRNARYKKRYY